MKHTFYEAGATCLCRVLWCYDGDTVKIQTEHGTNRILRLSGIDAPEKGQLGFRSARVALWNKLEAAPCLFTARREDKYKRLVCDVVRAADVAESLSECMVRDGWAWWYRQFAPREWRLKAAEREARQQGRGIWAAPGNIPPWAWRRGKRTNGYQDVRSEEISEYRDTEDLGSRCALTSALLPDATDTIESESSSSRQKNYIRGKRSSKDRLTTSVE